MDSVSELAVRTGPPLEIAGATFSYAAQKFIIQAMCYFGHKAAEVAPCLGLLDDGRPSKTVEQVQAAWEHFQNNYGLLSDQRLWERDDARFGWQIEHNIKQAGLAQEKLRLKAKQLA